LKTSKHKSGILEEEYFKQEVGKLGEREQVVEEDKQIELGGKQLNPMGASRKGGQNFCRVHGPLEVVRVENQSGAPRRVKAYSQ